MVKFFRTSYRTLRRNVLTTTKLPALIALVVVAILGLFADHQNNLISRQALRSDVLAQIGLIRAKLEGNIYANIQLVRGLVATLSIEPDMDQRRFERLAATLFSEKSQLRNIAVAPNFVVKLVYPLAGNEKVLGFDLSKEGAQRETVLKVRDTGELVLAGPVNLVQGGTGFVGRFPVFVYRAGNERASGVSFRRWSMRRNFTATADCSTQACRSISPSPARMRAEKQVSLSLEAQQWLPTTQ